MHLVKKIFCKLHWKSNFILQLLSLFSSYVIHNAPRSMWDKGKFASKKVIHMVLIGFCREVRVQCKEKLFQTPACKPGFHVKISNKKKSSNRCG